MLALRNKAPIIPIWTERLADGRTRTIVDPEIEIQPCGNLRADMRRLPTPSPGGCWRSCAPARRSGCSSTEFGRRRPQKWRYERRRLPRATGRRADHESRRSPSAIGARSLPVLFLWLLCLVDYGRLVIPGPWPRQYIALSDLSRQFYPFQRFVAQRLADGHLPTWNPYLYAGHPQLADPQTAVFSPLGLIINLTAGHAGLSYVALEWRATLDYMLAALFAFCSSVTWPGRSWAA